MSRMYNMFVRIKGINPDKREQVEEAAEQEWHAFGDDWWFDKDTKMLTSGGDSTLCGGEEESEFTQRLAHAIWKANEGFCEIEVNATYLEDLPFETHNADEDDYDVYIQETAPNVPCKTCGDSTKPLMPNRNCPDCEFPEGGAK